MPASENGLTGPSSVHPSSDDDSTTGAHQQNGVLRTTTSPPPSSTTPSRPTSPPSAYRPLPSMTSARSSLGDIYEDGPSPRPASRQQHHPASHHEGPPLSLVPTQETSLLSSPPSFYPTSTIDTHASRKLNGFLSIIPSRNKNRRSIADGLLQVQSQIDHTLPLTQPDLSRSSSSLPSIGEGTSAMVSTVTTRDAASDTVEGIHHLQHDQSTKFKKYGSGKFSNMKRHSIAPKSSSSSMESIAPLCTEQMLKNPVLADVSQYDGSALKPKNTTNSIRTFTNADLLTQQVANVGIASNQRFEKHADVLVENQRGWFILGYPFFSHNMLFSLDPSPWTYGPTNKPAPGDVQSFPLPDPSWDWTWNRWYVDMAYDVDDQGWSYSWRFASDVWHGSHVWFHSFVRRRRWIRLRHRLIPAQSDTVGSTTLNNSTTVPRTLSPANSISSFRSIRSNAPSIMDNTSYDYRMMLRSAAEAQQYGNRYFVVPPAGRVEAAISSPKRVPGGAGTQPVPAPFLTSLPSARKTEFTVPGELAQPAGDDSGPSADQRSSGHQHSSSVDSHLSHRHREFDPFGSNPSLHTPHSLSELLVDLHSARIDRERLEIITKFASDLTNYPALVAAVRTAPENIYVRRILQTFTHLDSKKHLVEHLNEVLEGMVEALKYLKKDNKAAWPADTDPHIVKRQKKVLKQHTSELLSLTQVITRIVQQQQYYTDKDIDVLVMEDAVESADRPSREDSFSNPSPLNKQDPSGPSRGAQH